ncbi:Gfo/Idh/MocA family protein [Lichenicola sp.]|uniref:Gfo/Idh/MocA family protein n=1 Tax=Lichenicola sp. TaxID=2804529 RepID=UPI003AFF75B3
MSQRLRVGIVGLKPDDGWAARAHVPALRALDKDFELVGAANSSPESSVQAAAAFDLPQRFSSVEELVTSDMVDVVTVTVRVPYHFDIVTRAIQAGKSVYCEWPLGNGLSEAEELAALAARHSAVCVVGTQARLAPEIQYLRALISNGIVGQVLSTTLVATGGGWGGSIGSEKASGYLLDNADGATMLTIPVGHALAALRDVVGELREISAVVVNRRPLVRVIDTGATLPMTAADQVLVAAISDAGIPVSVHYRGGSSPDRGLVWEVNGTAGDLRLVAKSGHVQLEPLTLSGARAGATGFEVIEVPAQYLENAPGAAVSGNVARVYSRMAADIRNGTRTAPDFQDAVELHKVLEAVQDAALSGGRVMTQTSNRLLPALT